MLRSMLRLLLLAATVLVSTTVWSQNTYFSTSFATAGDSFLVSNVSLFELGNKDFSPTGANYTWDYSGLNPFSQRMVNFVTPNSTGFLPSFLLTCTFNCANACMGPCVANGSNSTVCTAICNASCGTDCLGRWGSDFNLAELTADSINLGIATITQVYNLYKKENNGLYQNAIGARISNIPLVAQYDAPDRVYRFPMRYGDSTVSVSSYALKLDSIPGTGINFSFAYKHAQTRTNYVEGWGTVITPYATYDSVLKHKSIIHNRDSVTVLGNTITLDNFLPNEFIPDTIIEYSWFSRREGIPVLKVTAWLINGNEIYQKAEFRDTIRCFEPYAIFGYLPIPATLSNGDDSVEVNFYSLSFNANTFAWDFADTNSTTNTAQGQNPSHWYTQGGLYSVTLTVCNTGCVAGWCEDVTLPVLVIDNRTVGLSQLPNDGDWSIGPNPFVNSLTMMYNGNAATSPQFMLTDIAGRQLELPEPTANGQQYTWQGLGHLPEGVYILHIHSGATRSAIRIVKIGW